MKMKRWSALAEDYDPLKCGSIDGTDTQVHDRAVHRALRIKYHPNKSIKGNAQKTIFVSRLSHQTSASTLHQIFSTFGDIENVSLIKDIVTGFSRGYAFIEYKEKKSRNEAYKEGHNLIIDGNKIIVDYEFERTMPGWIPRRLGGGFGGKKESGQLRFGCRDRPFKRPIDFSISCNKNLNTHRYKTFEDSHCPSKFHRSASFK